MYDSIAEMFVVYIVISDHVAGDGCDKISRHTYSLIVFVVDMISYEVYCFL